MAGRRPTCATRGLRRRARKHVLKGQGDGAATPCALISRTIRRREATDATGAASQQPVWPPGQSRHLPGVLASAVPGVRQFCYVDLSYCRKVGCNRRSRPGNISLGRRHVAESKPPIPQGCCKLTEHVGCQGVATESLMRNVEGFFDSSRQRGERHRAPLHPQSDLARPVTSRARI